VLRAACRIFAAFPISFARGEAAAVPDAALGRFLGLAFSVAAMGRAVEGAETSQHLDHSAHSVPAGTAVDGTRLPIFLPIANSVPARRFTVHGAALEFFAQHYAEPISAPAAVRGTDLPAFSAAALLIPTIGGAILVFAIRQLRVEQVAIATDSVSAPTAVGGAVSGGTRKIALAFLALSVAAGGKAILGAETDIRKLLEPAHSVPAGAAILGTDLRVFRREPRLTQAVSALRRNRFHGLNVPTLGVCRAGRIRRQGKVCPRVRSEVCRLVCKFALCREVGCRHVGQVR